MEMSLLHGSLNATRAANSTSAASNSSTNNIRNNSNNGYDAESTNDDEEEADVDFAASDVTSSLLQQAEPGCSASTDCAGREPSSNKPGEAQDGDEDSVSSKRPLISSNRDTVGTSSPVARAISGANLSNRKRLALGQSGNSAMKSAPSAIGKQSTDSCNTSKKGIVSPDTDKDTNGGGSNSGDLRKPGDPRVNWPMKRTAPEAAATPTPSDGPLSDRTGYGGSSPNVGGVLGRREAVNRPRLDQTIDGRRIGPRGSDDTDLEEGQESKMTLTPCGNVREFNDTFRIRIKKPANTSLQVKVYNFLERPTGWKCFIYHFTV
ncbi:potassium voltage-gated channel subfamily kqt member 1 [Plakobranchus ocellatus]|uniref:Potassium voltage-gated channel subfamily kqt member 1 n=1 Tax=Plakobranchus ocellatus TaxID=259542 RepID=A0AAV4AJV3_9GAST|nr:potassium voltage-gated channel subfamily kqt member 1 [Plakobranchus ocellatus]